MTVALFIVAPKLSYADSTQRPASYQASLLNNRTSHINLLNKSYVITDANTPFQIQNIIERIKSGEAISHANNYNHIRLDADGRGVWIILPIVNQSSHDTWALDLGTFSNGRFASLASLSVYNMNTKKYEINTDFLSEKEQSIPSSIHINIPAGQTSFYILHLKAMKGSISFISPSLSIANHQSIADIFSTLLYGLIGIAALLFFLKSSNHNLLKPHFFIGIIWLLASVLVTFPTHFIYIGFSYAEFISPIIWMVMLCMSILSLLSAQQNPEHLPAPLLGGLTSLFLISSIAGIILLNMLPQLGATLIYVPVFIGFSLISLSCFIAIRSGGTNAKYYIPLGCSSLFLGIILFCMGLLSLEIIDATSFTLSIPNTFILLAIIGTIATSVFVDFTSSKEIDSSVSPNAFQQNQLQKNEMLQIFEAKEQSEHKRLIQVIEQERSLMSDLQLKTAQQNENLRKSKEAADEANRAKSAFLAVVSHEIRTPMTGIMGMLRLLQETQLSKEQKEYATTIKDSGDAMLALLNDILDFEKIESGKMDLEHISFDLRRLVKGVHTLMRGHAEAKNIDIVLDIDATTPTWVQGDPTRLRQVILNLINNAIKFTSKGSIFLRVRDLTGESDELLPNNHQIYFAVQDSGIGINAEAQKNLFVPFAQADSSISRKYGGTGLGLAICKRLIQAMGGTISINSKENEGSTFFFTLTMPSGNETAEDGDSSSINADSIVNTISPLPLHPLNVLIVDDNGINQKVAAGFVEKLGSHAITASSGADALDMLAHYKFDLIFMDLNLPDMSGIDITKKIRNLSHSEKSSIPIVALTGNTNKEDIDACYESGMNDFATKPITFEKVAELLRKFDKNFSSLSNSVSTLADDIDFSDEEAHHDDSKTDDNEDDNSFDLAVKKFEDIEKSLSASAPPSNDGKSQFEMSGLDETILKSLRSGLSIEQINEILVGFYEKADELIAAIGTSYLSTDNITLYARAHELKGMAGNFGFSGVSRLCATIEKAAKDNNLSAAKDAVERLGDHYAVARRQLTEWLNTE